MSARAAVATIPELGHDILRGLYAHRLLSTSQITDLYGWDRTPRWSKQVLADLLAGGLVARARIAARRSREWAWYLTPAGFDITEGPGVEVRPYRITAQLAAGPQQAHTLATNEVGAAFVRAARLHGDDCSTEAWRNETAHKIGAGGRGDVVIADAVLDYTVVATGSTFLCRFVELDRATMKLQRLVAKLESYARLLAHPPAWRSYPVFPPIMVITAGLPEAALQRRLDALAGVLPLSAPIANAGAALAITATTLEQLRTHGPFAPIFWRQGTAHLVDFRGRAGRR